MKRITKIRNPALALKVALIGKDVPQSVQAPHISVAVSGASRELERRLNHLFSGIEFRWILVLDSGLELLPLCFSKF